VLADPAKLLCHARTIPHSDALTNYLRGNRPMPWHWPRLAGRTKGARYARRQK
jgi:hypothetical protein